MSAIVIDGGAVASRLRERVAAVVHKLSEEYGVSVCLSTVLVGDHPASQVYVRNKITACGKVGIASHPVCLSGGIPQEELSRVLEGLNANSSINGILLQLPLPKQLDSNKCLSEISPIKDVDGLSPYSQGLLIQGSGQGFSPCTPAGILRLIHTVQRDLAGLRALVIGRSLLVGRPIAELLVQQNCTVTVAHSRTVDLAAIAREADIVIAAAGVPRLVRSDWVKRGAIVIDVGINRREDGKLIGDVVFEEVCDVARALTPVPGGVGPMTVASVLVNTVLAACRQHGKEDLYKEAFAD